MSGEITNKTHVLVTRLGDYWVSLERGQKIMAIIQRDPNAQIEFDGSYIMARNVEGLLGAGEYHGLQCKRRGMWQCKYSEWHGRNDTCYCAQNKARERMVYKPVEERKRELTPEQKERNKQRLAAMRKKLMRKGIAK